MHMPVDSNNFFLAALSSVPAMFAVTEAPSLLTIMSVIVLPIVFFMVGKGIDIWLQVRLSRHKHGSDKEVD